MRFRLFRVQCGGRATGVARLERVVAISLIVSIVFEHEASIAICLVYRLFPSLRLETELAKGCIGYTSAQVRTEDACKASAGACAVMLTG
jgi:hypothetical protein